MALLVAVLATVLFGFAAIVVDLGYARTVRGDAQSAVDASSLAAAGILSKEVNPSSPFDDANKAIKELAQANFETKDNEWATCDASKPGASWVQGGSGTNCIMFNHAVNPTKVQVVLPSKHVDSFFGGLVGYSGMDIGARAQATIRQDDVPGCALCVMGSLDISGPVAVDGGIDGGSSSAGANSRVRTGGSITVQDPGAITFTDTPSPASGPSYSSRPIIRTVTDPFAGDTMPVGDPGSTYGDFAEVSPPVTGFVICGAGDVLTAGTYRNIRVTAPQSDPCTGTGVIVVTGQLRVVSGGALSLTSAALQFSCGTRTDPKPCASLTPGGRLRIDAGGQLTMVFSLSPFSIVADANNTSAMTVSGNAVVSVDQAVYGHLTAVTLGDGASVTAFGQISVDKLKMGSDSAVTVTAAGAEPLPGPPMVGLYR